MSIADLQVGDSCLLVDKGFRGKREVKEVTISKVGRKWIYIQRYGTDCPFDRQTGYEKSNYTPKAFLITSDDLEAADHRSELIKRMGEGGLEFKFGFERSMPTHKLEGIVSVLESGEVTVTHNHECQPE